MEPDTDLLGYQEHLRDSMCGLSTEECVQVCRKWLKLMAQPFTRYQLQGCIKFHTTLYSSPPPIYWIMIFSSNFVPFPNLIFFPTALILLERLYCVPFIIQSLAEEENAIKKQNKPYLQCFGSVSFWYGSGSKSDLKSRKYQHLFYFFSIKNIFFSEILSVLIYGVNIYVSKHKLNSSVKKEWYSNDLGWFFCVEIFHDLAWYFCYPDPFHEADPADQNETEKELYSLKKACWLYRPSKKEPT